MSKVPPPNQALVDLAAVLGEDNVRTLVRTFLRDFPVAVKDLGSSDRRNRHRLAHSMKSNSRLIGALVLSARMAALEQKLSTENGEDVTPQDLAGIASDLAEVTGPLKKFVGD